MSMFYDVHLQEDNGDLGLSVLVGYGVPSFLAATWPPGRQFPFFLRRRFFILSK